jgi:hypothetical protein
MPQHTSTILSRLRYNIILNFLVVTLWLFVAHKYCASNNSHPGDESYYYAHYKNNKIAHLVKLPSARMDGTQRPTKIACCLLISASPRNHSVTLKTKLANAATRK